MDIEALVQGIRDNDEDAVRELIRSRGAEVLAHALALADGNKSVARALSAEAFRNAVGHLRAFPEEKIDEAALSRRIDAELVEAARRKTGETVSRIVESAEREPPRVPDAGRARPGRRPRAAQALMTLLLALCALLALWLLSGILMSMRYLPYIDLGYTWFNRTVFVLF